MNEFRYLVIIIFIFSTTHFNLQRGSIAKTCFSLLSLHNSQTNFLVSNIDFLTFSSSLFCFLILSIWRYSFRAVGRIKDGVEKESIGNNRQVLIIYSGSNVLRFRTYIIKATSVSCLKIERRNALAVNHLGKLARIISKSLSASILMKKFLSRQIIATAQCV